MLWWFDYYSYKRIFILFQQQPEVYRAGGTLYYDDEPSQLAYENKVPARFERTRDPLESDILSVSVTRKWYISSYWFDALARVN